MERFFSIQLRLTVVLEEFDGGSDMRGELLTPKQKNEKRREYMRRWRAKHKGKST